jgi:hypothetical protein
MERLANVMKEVRKVLERTPSQEQRDMQAADAYNELKGVKMKRLQEAIASVKKEDADPTREAEILKAIAKEATHCVNNIQKQIAVMLKKGVGTEGTVGFADVVDKECIFLKSLARDALKV